MNAVVLLSGGMDSQVALASVRPEYEFVHCLGFDYGQRHLRELDHAFQISRYYGATFEVVHLPTIAGSALTGSSPMPTGLPPCDPGQSATVVPGRNAAMISLAVASAVARGAAVVVFGANSGDAAVYQDCRPEFVRLMSDAMSSAYGVSVHAPLLFMEKREIAALGRSLRVQLEDSWSCYAGGVSPCGECGACVARSEALA